MSAQNSAPSPTDMSQSSLALGAGTAAAVMLPGWLGSEAVGLTAAAGAYAAAQAAQGDTVEFLSLGGTGLGGEADRAVRVGTATLGWVLANTVAVPVLRALPLPRPLVAAGAGYAVAWANERFSAYAAQARSASQSA